MVTDFPLYPPSYHVPLICRGQKLRTEKICEVARIAVSENKSSQRNQTMGLNVRLRGEWKSETQFTSKNKSHNFVELFFKNCWLIYKIF